MQTRYKIIYKMNMADIEVFSHWIHGKKPEETIYQSFNSVYSEHSEHLDERIGVIRSSTRNKIWTEKRKHYISGRNVDETRNCHVKRAVESSQVTM